MDQLDILWLTQPQEAARIAREYLAAGYTHVPVGTLGPETYSNQNPVMDWREHGPERFAAYLSWLASMGLEWTFFLLYDGDPYFGGPERGWDLELCARDFDPFFLHPTVQALTRRVCVAWEQWSSTRNMVAAFRFIAARFPNTERLWHNGPGHLSPALSDEDEQGAHRACAAAGMTGMAVQCHPPDDSNGTDPIVRARYDVWDIARRYNGRDGSPWGGPVTRPDGTPLTVECMEVLAHRDYWDGPPAPDDAPRYRAAMLAIPGVVHVLDA